MKILGRPTKEEQRQLASLALKAIPWRIGGWHETNDLEFKALADRGM